MKKADYEMTPAEEVDRFVIRRTTEFILILFGIFVILVDAMVFLGKALGVL